MNLESKNKSNNSSLITADIQQQIQKYSIHNVAFKDTFIPALWNYRNQKQEFEIYLHAIVKILQQTLDFFAVKYKATPENLFTFVLLAIEKYKDLAYTDFVLFAKSIMLGNINSHYKNYIYPKVYDRIDAAYLIEALNLYYQAKIDEREYWIQKKKNDKNLENQHTLQQLQQNNPTPYDYKSILQNILNDKVQKLLQHTIKHNQQFQNHEE
jgi:hypothetical protein